MTTHPYRAAVEQGASMAQTILVTGSTSGFGRLTVETLARQGYRVFAGMRAAAGKNAPAAEDLRARAQREALALHSIEIDVTDDASVERAIAVIIETPGRLDVVVNNAGISYIGPLEAFTPEQVRQQFETNVFGVLRVNRAVLPQMRKQGSGLLLQIGSIAGRLAMPYLGLYAATKFAVEGLTESYRYELAPFGIDAAILEPGTYPTTISANRQVAADAERFALYQAGIDAFMVRFYAENRSATPPDPQEVADAVAHVIPAGPHGGAYAEYVVVPATSVVLAPAGVDFPAASTLLLNGLTARLALDALALDAGQTMAVTGAAGAFGGYVIQLAKADGLSVIADASRSDQTLVRSLGADYVLDRGDTFAERVRSIVAEGVPGLADGARLNHLALPAIADGGAMAVILGWDGPIERHITLHKISSTAFATNTALLNPLVRQVEQGILTLRVADVLPADQAVDAHRRLEAGGVRGRLVLDFTT